MVTARKDLQRRIAVTAGKTRSADTSRAPTRRMETTMTHNPAIAFRGVVAGCKHGHLRSAPRTESEAVLRKRRFVERAQNLMHRLLNHTINRRRYAQLPHAAVRFRYLDAANRRGFVRSVQQLFLDVLQVFFQVIPKFLHAHSVNAG